MLSSSTEKTEESNEKQRELVRPLGEAAQMANGESGK